MLNTKAMEKEAFADARDAAKLRITFNGSTVIENESILSAKLTENLADKNITIGGAFSQSFEMSLRMPEDGIALTGAYLIAEAGFDGNEWVKLGRFYVTEVSTSDDYKTVSISASDRMALLTEDYTPGITLPTSAEDLLKDIASQYSLKINEKLTCADVPITQTYEGTVRDYLGWMAGLSGANARFNREGELAFTWYEKNVATYGDATLDNAIDAEDIAYIRENLLGSATTEEREAILGRLLVGEAYVGAEKKDEQRGLLADVNQDGIIDSKDVDEIEAYLDGTPYSPTLVGSIEKYMQLLSEDQIERNGFTLSASQAYTIRALISGTEDAPLETGSGKAINFYNPYMTQAALDAIAEKQLPFSYYAAKVMYRGNPAWEIGDILHIDAGFDVPIMSQTMEFGKKLTATVKSLGISDEEESASSIAYEIKDVERQLPGIRQMILEINNSLLSGDAGYMELIMEDFDGKERLSGFRIMDTPTLTDNTKGWLANKNGIGWSSDGFKTISKIGLDMANGAIYADQIASGAVITNEFTATNANITGGRIVFEATSSAQNLIKLDYTGEEYSYSAAVTPGSVAVGAYDKAEQKRHKAALEPGTITATDEIITDGTVTAASVAADSVDAGSINVQGSDIMDTFALISHTHSGDTISPSSVRASGEIYEYGTMLQNRYAAKSHTHSGYYESGDNIYANKLYIQGAGTISGDPNARLATSSPYQLGYASGSSRAFKHDIKPVENPELDPEKLYDIEVVQFKYNEDYLEESDQRYRTDCIGFIAEQVYEVYPIAADCETGSPKNWEMRYLIPPMLALIQKQKKELDALKKEVEALKGV